MNYKLNISIVLCILLLSILIQNTNSLYMVGLNKGTKVDIAKPICRAIVDESLFISNFSKKPFYFSICNFDEKGNISDTAMKYLIIFNINQINLPIKYKLYRINEDRSEKEIQLEISDNIVKTKELVLMKIDNQYKDNYRLEINYESKNNINLSNDLKVSLELYSEQYIPNGKEEI